MNGRLTTAIICLVLGAVGTAEAQTFDTLSIRIEAKTINVDGGERRNTSSSTGAIEIGKTHSAGFAKMQDMCGFGVAAWLEPGAVSGWTVSVTPIRVEGDAVTFRLEWVRARDQNRNTSSPSGNVEVTMRPGESMPVDQVPLSPDVTMPYERCGVRATSLRVGVERYPSPNQDPRVVGTELWLVERLPDGSERGQALSLRGRPYEETSFYFDTITDGSVGFELYGDIAAAPSSDQADEMLVTIVARGRVTANGEVSTSIAAGTTVPQGTLMQARSVESEIRVGAGEIVDVELPRLTENDLGAFADRVYSLRIRSRRIR